MYFCACLFKLAHAFHIVPAGNKFCDVLIKKASTRRPQTVENICAAANNGSLSPIGIYSVMLVLWLVTMIMVLLRQQLPAIFLNFLALNNSVMHTV